MAWKQVRDVLDRVRQFHQQLSDYYEEVGERADDERIRFLLDYMQRHEKNLKSCLAKYESSGAQAVLDTWLNYTPEESLDRALREAELDSEMSPDEVIGAALKLDQALIALYEQLSESTAAPRVHELFTNLLQLEESKEQQYARSLLELEGESNGDTEEG